MSSPINFIRTISLSAVLFSVVLFFVPSSLVHATIINKSVSTADSALTNTDLTNGLVGYWPFDGQYMTWVSATVGTSIDASGNGNNGTLVNMGEQTSVVAGKIGQALSFNGINQTISVPDSTSLSSPVANNSITVSAWIKVPSNSGTYREIMRGAGGWFFLLNNDNEISLSTSGASGEFESGYAYTADNKWHLVTGTFDGTTIRLYEDGVFETSYSGGAITTGTDPLYIGSLTGSAQYFSGSISDARIYNRALSAMEVEQLYNSGLTTIDNTNINLTNTDLNTSGSTNLKAYYPLSGQYMTWVSATVGTSTDASGNGNNGTLVGMNRSTSVVPGRSGQALLFNGATTYVQGNNSSLIAGNAMTVCAWIKQSSFVSTANAIVANTDFIFFTSSTNDTLDLTSNGSTNAVSATNAIKNGVWKFVCGTRVNGANGIANLYVNGALSGTANQTSGTPALSTFDTDIGVKGNAIADFFAGAISDVRIYGRVLSAKEIAQLYNKTKGDTVNKSGTGLTNTDLTSASSTTGGNPSGLVGYWPFDGKYMTWVSATVGTSTDASGNGLNGTLVDMSRATSTVAGRIGQALKFNGVDSYVNVGAISHPISTIAFWFNPMTTSQNIINISTTGSVSIVTTNAVLTPQNISNSTIYIDGVATSTVGTGWHFVVVTTTSPPSPDAFTIGRVGSSAYFNGVLDEVRIYNRILSAKEVEQLYNMGI